MSKPTHRIIGRGERVLPGVWRLRLPLPWAGVPHCNAWAIASGEGIVLVDTGMHQPGSMAHLERALAQVGLQIETVRLVVCTHAHSDHCGEAMTIVERAGCELWLHPDHEHLTRMADDPELALMRRAEVARQSGIPEDAIRRWLEQRRESGIGVAGTVAPHRDLVEGVVVESDLGPWTVIETPGHAPSHVCLHQPDRRLLISGDHVLGRVSHYYDYGFTPDPVQEFLDSLDRVDALDARLALAGHGRPFTDIGGHVEANRALVRQRLHAVRTALAERTCTAYELAARVYGPLFGPTTAAWLMNKLLCYLTHLERVGEAVRFEPQEQGAAETWGPA